MPTEPERPIEDLLRRYVRQRRDQAGPPFELHPATRRLLQGEVARRFPARKTDRGWFFRLSLWPRLALSVAGLLGLCIAVSVFVLPRGQATKEQLMAKNQSMSDSARTRTTAGALTPPEATPGEPRPDSPTDRPEPPPAKRELVAVTDTAVPSAERQPAASRPAGLSETRSQSNVVALRVAQSEGGVYAPASPSAARYGMAGAASGRPGIRAARPSSDALVSAPQVLTKQKDVAEQSNQPATVAAIRPTGDLTGATGETKLPTLAQQFVRSTGSEGLSPTSVTDSSPVDSVLLSFKLEQSGEEIRVIDQDGSIYRGFVQDSETVAATPAPSRDRASRAVPLSKAQPEVSAAFAGAKLAEPASAYFFRVTGTNRSLNQRIVFTGTLLPAEGTVSAGSTNALSLVTAGVAFDKLGSRVLPLTNSRVSGKVLVGDRKVVDINAMPSKP